MLADLYADLEAAVRAFGDVEIVARDRYALFRTTRIFADLAVTTDALRVVVHLTRKADVRALSRSAKMAAESRTSHSFVRRASFAKSCPLYAKPLSLRHPLTKVKKDVIARIRMSKSTAR